MKEYISQDAIVRISEKADIVEIVSRYVNLKKSGKNYKGLCPFHIEKTPSFFVNPEKQIFHCFGCGTGGDVFKFLMNIENISFPEAVAKIGKEVGIEIKLQKGYTSNKEKNALVKANEFALKNYSELIFSSQGKLAFEYLYTRNFDEKAIKEFSIGYAPYDRDFLVRKVEENGLNKDDFIKAGLIADNGEKDVFRNRIMFPIFNWNGEVIGFGGRGIEDNAVPKYLNTKNNMVFDKSKVLFGIFWAREQIREKNYAIVVEGYFDVLKLMLNNIKNVIAPMGTSLAEGHLNILKRYTDKILLVFDSDSAGINASLRTLESVLSNGFEVKICSLPKGFDPDKFIDEYGINPFLKMLNSSMNFIDFIIEVKSQDFDLDSPRGKSSIIKEVSKLISSVPDEIERNEYIKYLSRKTDVEKEIINRYIEENRNTENLKIEKKENNNIYRNNAEAYLLKVILDDENYIKEIMEHKDKLTEKMKEIINVVEQLESRNIKPTVSNIVRSIDDEKLVNFISNITVDENTSFSEEKKRRIFDDCLRKVKEKALKEKLKKKKREITAKNVSYSEKELEEIQSLLYQLKKGR